MMSNRPSLAVALSALTVCVVLTPASAATYYYGAANQATTAQQAHTSFLAALGGAPTAIEDFEDNVPVGNLLSLNVGETAPLAFTPLGLTGSVRRDASLFGVLIGHNEFFQNIHPHSGTGHLVGQALPFTTLMTLTFDQPITAFGFYGNASSDMRVSLGTESSVPVTTATPYSDHNGVIPYNFFFGATSDTPFTTVSFFNNGNYNHALGMDDLEIAPAVSVPLPAAAWMGSGLLGVAGVLHLRKRRRSA